MTYRTCFGCNHEIVGTPANVTLVSTQTNRKITIVVCQNCAKKLKEATEVWYVT